MIIHTASVQGCIQKIFPGGGKLGPHKRMTLAIMIFAYIYTRICLLRFALFEFEGILEVFKQNNRSIQL